MAPYTQQESDSDAETRQHDLNLNGTGAQWDIDLSPEVIADLVNRTDIPNIFEGLEGLEPPPIRPTAVNTIQPDDNNTSQGPRRSRGRSGSNRGGRRTLTDKESRQRRTELQRNYRERERQELEDAKKKVYVIAAEIEVERAQQDAILAERTVLTKATEYWTSSISLASSIVSNAIDKVRSGYNQAVELVEGLPRFFSLQEYTPSDRQLHAFLARKDLKELQDIFLKVRNRCLALVTRWNDEPEARENIEAQMERLRVMRLRSVKYLLETRPEIVMELNKQPVFTQMMMPTGPDGAPNPKLVEAVATLELTPEQLESFERKWVFYLQKTESIRQEARSTLHFLASSGADERAAGYSYIGASELFLGRLQAVQVLASHPASRANAMIEFSLWLSSSLTMPQKEILSRSCMPYYLDAIQIGRIVFGDDYGKAASAVEVQSLPTSEMDMD